MLTLDSVLHIPAHVSFSIVGEDSFLLNVQTSKYFRLEDVGTRLWQLLNENDSLRNAYQVLLREYEVESVNLESDLIELVERLVENGLVELVRK